MKILSIPDLTEIIHCFSGFIQLFKVPKVIERNVQLGRHRNCSNSSPIHHQLANASSGLMVWLGARFLGWSLPPGFGEAMDGLEFPVMAYPFRWPPQKRWILPTGSKKVHRFQEIHQGSEVNKILLGSRSMGAPLYWDDHQKPIERIYPAWWTVTFCHGKIHHFNGKIHYFDWAIFNCEVLVHQRVYPAYPLYPVFVFVDSIISKCLPITVNSYPFYPIPFK